MNKENIYYTMSTNEDGWFDASTKDGDDLGFRPDLDIELLYVKIQGILTDMNYDSCK